MVEHYQLLTGVRSLPPEAGLKSKRGLVRRYCLQHHSKVSVTAAITSPTSFVVVEN